MKSRNIYSLPVKIKNEVIAVTDTRVHFGILKYAVDFSLKKNVPILAAQSGEVIRVKDNSNKGGDDEKYADEKFQNMIIIKHDNDEYTEYVHIDHKSALVKKGDFVKKGHLISKGIGIIGYTTEPHLHFAVFRLVGNKDNFNSIPIVWEKGLIIEKQKNNFLQLNFKKFIDR